MKNEKSAENAAKKNTMTDEQTETLLDQAMEKSKKQKTKQQPIRLDKLHPFENHPYKIMDDEAMVELKASIKDVGLLNRIIVRPLENTADEYEIISGHRRVHAAELLGMKEVPAVVYFIDRDEATLLMVDSNNQRETLLPSEKAFAYKMKADALTHQGKASGQVVPKSDDNRTTAKIGEAAGDSYKTVQRYIRLTYLIPELLDLMDEGKIALTVGVELSYLDDQSQYDVLDICEQNDCTPSYSQSYHLHKAMTEGTLNKDFIIDLLSKEKANQKQIIKLYAEKFESYIPRSYNAEQTENYLLKACECYKKVLQKQKEQAR